MYIGIDLGTSNSAIFGHEEGKLRLFKTSDGRDVLPSVIHVDRRGHQFVGHKAYVQSYISPDNVVKGFKRLLGTSTPLRFSAAGREVSAEEASAEILRTLMGQVGAEVGQFEQDGTIVTIPAAFNQMQSESTIRAARAAGIDRVGLLQEPIAAAMAALEGARNSDGQFLIYDIGGGTLDVALVRSIKGSVTVLAHEGINMLGGQDFDNAIVNSVIRPWLLARYDLPDDFQRDPAMRRLIGMARVRAEEAKIELSTHDSSTIFVSEEDARTQDASGEDIYIDVPIDRTTLERLISDRVSDSIALCRKVMEDHGLSRDDLDRVVMIGGPSKMPLIRDRIPAELGVAPDLKTDPMTAVARGAAIFAESRDWSEEQSARKGVRASQQSRGPAAIKVDFEARTASSEAIVRITATGDLSEIENCRVRLVTDQGWDSGEKTLSTAGTTIIVEQLAMGPNQIDVNVSDASGSRVAASSQSIQITRIHASATAVPATNTIAVEIVDEGAQKTLLEPLITKGTPLPGSGQKKFRSSRNLRHGDADSIPIKLYQQTHGVVDPDLNLFIGSVDVTSNYLEPGQTLQKGAEIIVDWKVDDNGLLTCDVTVPSVELKIDKHQFYSDSLGHQNFAGDSGMLLASEALQKAQNDINELESDLGDSAREEVAALRRRLTAQTDRLATADLADTNRSVTEEARHIRQSVSTIRHSDKHRTRALTAELSRISEWWADIVEDADVETAARFQQIAATARSSLAKSPPEYEVAQRAINELGGIFWRTVSQQPAYIMADFEHCAKERHLALDPQVHDNWVRAGRAAASEEDWNAVREATYHIHSNRAEPRVPGQDLSAVAGLLRH